ncbi:MAG: ABC transporter ATP-binding protein [Candidatus Auribacter fodinae]|jgi:ATP-binding cassette subfamily F protein 3|uniref:ABC transporter ATP-binding protein n=1 Tax=Candidatus Auribacter fodinae TaxID=2093366 RepID=A0A3A4QXV0_9BACT|nr:MAG: ABC transporter ATP-binding protein [Candidatus Auribacter fodinae]
MINLSGVSKRFGTKLLYENVSIALKPGEKIGLVGANGSGKSTLLNMVSGKITPDSGDVMLTRGFRIGFLEQEFESPGDKTVIEEVKGTFLKHEKVIQDLNEQMANTPDQQSLQQLMRKYEDVEHAFETRGGYDLEATCRKVLGGLGFSDEMMRRNCSQFSGGQKMRIALAKLLVEHLDCILLDEPTNHLDLPAIMWFEEYLKSYTGLIIMISHDRSLLNNVSNRIVEITGQQIYTYEGNYDYYIEEKAKRLELIQKAAKLEQKERMKIERFIERFRYKNTKASLVQSRVKQLEKRETTEIPLEEHFIDFKFPQPDRSGYEVVKLENITKSFGRTVVLEGFSGTFLRGEKIAVTGRNGTGKSTLLKIITGELEPDSGTVKKGMRVTIGYFSQFYAEQLDPNNTIMEEMDKLRGTKSPTDVRKILGRFFFSGDEVFKKIGVLSGGEKSRVLMAKLFLSDANMLILDEPTNHLDIGTQRVLLDALDDFTGTICFVSHDRHFINSIATRLIYFDTNLIDEYPGTLDEYLQSRQPDSLEPKYASVKVTNERKERKRQEAEERNQRFSIRKQYDDAIERIEEELESLMREENELTQKLADTSLYKNPDNARQVNERYQQVRDRIEILTSEWEKNSLEREKFL